MSGEQRRSGAPQGPPWPPELLADLQAGALDPHEAEKLRAHVQHDEEARAVLAALDSVGEDLSSLPAPSVPEDVATRLDTALDAEVRAMQQRRAAIENTQAPPPTMPADRDAPTTRDRPSPAPAVGDAASESAQPGRQRPEVVDLSAARNRRRRRLGMSAGLLAAAAVTGIVVFATLPGEQEMQADDPPPDAQPAPQNPPLALNSDEISPAEFQEVFRSDQLGALSEPQKLIGCLQANGVDSGRPLGARTVTIDGRPGQMLVLPTGQIGEFRLLTVGPDCGPGNPATLSDTTFGG